jgi:hypothetical protein
MDAACKLPEEVASKHLILLFLEFFLFVWFCVSVAVTLSFFFPFLALIS